MLKRIKRRIDHAKEKWHRLTDSSESTTLTTEPVGVSCPEPSHTDPAAANPSSLPVLPPAEPSDDSPHPDPKLVVSTSTSRNLAHASPNTQSNQPDLHPTRVPTQPISPMPEPEDVQNPAPEVSSLDNTRGLGSTAWSGLKTLIGVLNESADAFGPLKSAAGGLSRCIEIYEASSSLKNQVAARKEYSQLRTELNNISQEIAGYIAGHAPPSMENSVAKLARGIQEETEIVMQKTRRNGWERHAEAMEDADEILVRYQRIQGHLDSFADGIHQLTAGMNIWRIVDDQATRTLLKELPYSSAAKYNSAESGSLGRNGCTPHTRVDVLDQLQTWAKDVEGQNIYWLNGMAGTGKTTIAYSLCERLEQADCLAASFFCSRQLPECRNVSLIFPSIAYQLSLISRPFRYASYEKLKKNQDIHNTPVTTQFKSLISDPLREVQGHLPRDLVIAIDALDECSDADAVDSMLAALLRHATDLPIKLLVTSRPNPNILSQLNSEEYASVRSELQLHELERSVVQSDIKTYLTIELERMKPNAAHIDQLVERSGVLFVYASTVVRYVKQDSFAWGRKRLHGILNMPALPKNSQKGIDDLYGAILQAAFDEDRLDSSERGVVMQVLRTVICAQEPLSVDVIAGLLDLDDIGTVHAALGPFFSVLQVSSATGLVTTLHESFPDYLLDKERSSTLYCNAQQHHGWLAQVCFKQMKIPDRPFNICNLESSYIPDREVSDVDNRIVNAIPVMT
ncbi:hypothetical protein FRC07_007811 [Ceratobasidium sp. 392]|nr:hypothetical protein FRC07_007811 [Ceratobasidium sp. 392]